MSRNFENEYKSFMADEVPDLWSRIEGNLKEKEIVSVQTKTEMKMSKKERNKKVTSIYIKKYAVAACLCLVILVGGSIAVYRSNVQRLNDSSDIMDMASSDEAMDFAATGDAMPMEENAMAEVGMEETTMPEADMAESETLLDEEAEGSMSNHGTTNAVGNVVRVEQGNEQMDSQENMDDVVSEQDGVDHRYELEAKSSEKSTEEISDSKNMNYQAIVMITSIENTGEEILYYAQVLPSPYSVFKPGTNLVLCIGDQVVIEPEVGMNYKVAVEQLSETQTIENEMIYMIKGIEKQAE